MNGAKLAVRDVSLPLKGKRKGGRGGGEGEGGGKRKVDHRLTGLAPLRHLISEDIAQKWGKKKRKKKRRERGYSIKKKKKKKGHFSTILFPFQTRKGNEKAGRKRGKGDKKKGDKKSTPGCTGRLPFSSSLLKVVEGEKEREKRKGEGKEKGEQR